MLIAALVAAVVVAVPDRGARAGGFISGNTLHDWCTGEEGAFYDGACGGYVIGVFDALVDGMDKGGGTICPPESLLSRQLVDVVKKHLSDHPEDRHYRADSLVAEALSIAWPCP